MLVAARSIIDCFFYNVLIMTLGEMFFLLLFVGAFLLISGGGGKYGGRLIRVFFAIVIGVLVVYGDRLLLSRLPAVYLKCFNEAGSMICSEFQLQLLQLVNDYSLILFFLILLIACGVKRIISGYRGR